MMLRLVEAGGARARVQPPVTQSRAAGAVVAALAAVMTMGSEKNPAANEGGSVRDKIAAFGDKAAAVSSTAPSSSSRPVVMPRAAGRGSGGSVRDKIAKFGDNKAVNSGAGTNGTVSSASFAPELGTTSLYGSSRSSSASSSSSARFSGGAVDSSAVVKKLNVPDIFKNGSKPPESLSAGKSSGPAKKWSTVDTSVNGRSVDISAAASSRTAGGSGVSAASRSSSSSSRGSAFPKSSDTPAAEKGQRDLLGSSSSAKAASSRAVGSKSASGGAGSGSSSSVYTPYVLKETVGKSKPNAGKVQKGPRRLQMKTISAEKQRAALGLDKDKDDDEMNR